MLIHKNLKNKEKESLANLKGRYEENFRNKLKPHSLTEYFNETVVPFIEGIFDLGIFMLKWFVFLPALTFTSIVIIHRFFLHYPESADFGLKIQSTGIGVAVFYIAHKILLPFFTKKHNKSFFNEIKYTINALILIYSFFVFTFLFQNNLFLKTANFFSDLFIINFGYFWTILVATICWLEFQNKFSEP